MEYSPRLGDQMKVSFFPVMPCCETGSSRVRVYWLNDYLVKQGIDSHACYFNKGGAPSHIMNSDIFIFQKRYGPYWVRLAQAAKKDNIKIILDQVDIENVDKMHSIADVLTTDSRPLADYYQKLEPGVKAHVIEDSIAYLKSPLPPRKHTKREALKIVYFVSPSMMDNILVCHNALLKLRAKHDYNLIVVSGIPPKGPLGKLSYTHWKWSVEAFTSLLEKCDLAILPQKWNWKGGNKMVQAVTHNLPTVSSNTPSYRHIAEATGTEEFLCGSTGEWMRALDAMFDPDTRNQFLYKTSKWVWDNYNMDCIGQQWIDLFEELLG